MSVGLPSIACVHLVLILGQRLVFSYLQEYHIPKHLAWVYTNATASSRFRHRKSS